METAHALDPVFRDALLALVAQRKYVRVFYFTDLHEFMSETAILKGIHTEADGEYAELATGTLIRLDRLVNVDGIQSPGHSDFETCIACR